jgi:hypothetical protein
MATIKSFINKNSDNLFVKKISSFDGMTDCVQSVKDDFKKVTKENALGLKGVYIVGSSSDHITNFENDDFIGFEIYNCCGEGIIAIKKLKKN